MTIIRALRMAVGLTICEMAELLDCCPSSISFAERNIACRPIAKEEESFLCSCINVLDGNEKKEIIDIVMQLMHWDDIKSELRNSIIGDIYE